ncbi:MAG TPA: AI-2E family transporter [Streptosporangiaceae bacterium]|nr:AI-2E family transporter [Streptosporangiaceae bacterium]
MTDDADAAAGGTQSNADAGMRDSRDVGERTGNGNENGTADGGNENGAAAEEEEAEKDRIARGTAVREQIARGLGVRKRNRESAPERALVRTPEQARVTMPARQQNVAESSRVPSWLQTGAAWSWRLLLLGAAIYLIARILGILYIVVVPCIAALLLTALLQPLTARLRRAGLPGLSATWATLLIAAAVLGGLVLLVTNRVSADYSTMVAEAKHTTTQVESFLSGPPFHVKSSSVKNLLNNIPGYLSKHKSLVEGTVVTGGKIAAEFFGGLVLMLFVTFFLIKDGERIWNWLLGAMRPETARRVDRAGHASWLAVVYYMRGTVAVAAIHAVVVGLALWIMGVPLVIPLAVLVFVAAFVPLVGLLVAGTLAILVTLATRGWVDAIILLGVLIIEDQLEAHLLQPQVVGRVIRLHPLAVILSLAVGGVLAGIPGAVVAIPVVAVITRALPELRRGDPGPDEPG